MNYEVLIFSPIFSPRLQYILDFLSQYYGLSFRLTNDEIHYRQASEITKINYSADPLLQGEIHIHPHPLLSEKHVAQVTIECFMKHTENLNRKTYPCFFKTGGDLEFDLLAATFFLITRYEEYLPHKRDALGRFSHQESIAFKNAFLHLPLINIWMEDFRKYLARTNAHFNPSKTSFTFYPTYDIDMAWSYLRKGWVRNTGGIFLSLLQRRMREAVDRIEVLLGKKADPLDAYQWMETLHESYRLKPCYFILVATQINSFDKNINVRKKEFRKLIRQLADKYPVGLHPSWASGDRSSLIMKEKKTLEQITKCTLDASRQHYIRLKFPTTYQHLLNARVTHDYSMGYGTINGFRASITTPFYWYDLTKEVATKLLVHPFCFMDANSFYEQHQDAEKALEEMVRLYREIKAVDGTMITIWHNSFLGTGEEFRGWREVYEQFVGMVLTAS